MATHPGARRGGVSGERLTATAHGRVQGVGFRYWIVRHAQRLGVSGWVRNGEDGRSVELVAEGPAESLDELEEMMRRGPAGATVDRVTVRRSPVAGGLDGFRVAGRGM